MGYSLFCDHAAKCCTEDVRGLSQRYRPTQFRSVPWNRVAFRARNVPFRSVPFREIGSTDNINLVKYLLAQDVCQPMLLAQWTNRGCSLLPLDVARDLKVNHYCFLIGVSPSKPHISESALNVC